ncbi:Major facilitator superfamily domain, general substrate transporter [Moelleriella libera RCEF 2490]|uniref:Probable transporter MCH1 n=1 Tax=Moelleriella libera RCEF 2490 TaxID=1081109 RepID=A0A168EGE7_9HYPO|nr:Major facilitator superfamily domain, general substrate transporter [Moelleriella libera RCEF 2490]
MPLISSSDDQSLSTAPHLIAGENDTCSDSSVQYEDEGDELANPQNYRSARRKRFIRIISLIFATLCSLCAGSIVVFSLYAPRFQSRLRYTQLQINGLAIAGSLALYLPISIMGYVCDRVGVSPLALLSAALFGTGYGTAAFVYRKLDIAHNSLQHSHSNSHEWAYPVFILAFVCVGSGTCAMYIASVSTCAKNFGKGKYRGLALAMPITGFGLSGMWLSQFGSHVLYEIKPNGSRGDLDVFRFFAFLAGLLTVMGVLGTFLLRVVDEDDLIEEAIEELETSGLLDGNAPLGEPYRNYGTSIPDRGHENPDYRNPRTLIDADDVRWKRNWVLNVETRQFLMDRTMWPFAAAFLLMIGPAEAFINNLGTILGTLTPPSVEGAGEITTAAAHVSIFGATSTIARLLIGSLTDLIAPAPETQHIQLSGSQLLSTREHRPFKVSRIYFLLFFAILMSLGFFFLASGSVQNHADRFWIVSGLVGAGYGAIFSLVPLVVTIIWGVENFATNFGIIAMLPALGSTFWGLVYSGVYQAGAKRSMRPGAFEDDEHRLFCYGKHCYSGTFWAEGICVWVACLLVLFAWRGTGGWKHRGVLI